MAGIMPKVGGGCKPVGINKPDPRHSLFNTDREEWHRQRRAKEAADHAAAQAKHEEWLKTPEGQVYAQKEKERIEREAKRLTRDQWNKLFNEMLDKGFQPGDTAILDPEKKSILPTIHGKTGRRCVYIQISSVIDLDDRPKWMINPAHWRGALVCFLDGKDDGKEITAVECIRRGERSAWGKVVERQS